MSKHWKGKLRFIQVNTECEWDNDSMMPLNCVNAISSFTPHFWIHILDVAERVLCSSSTHTNSSHIHPHCH